MAQIIPTFELTYLGSGTLTSETWVDISGAIPVGKRIWLGYATCISDDKALTFEIRPNTAGQSTGTTTTTSLRASVVTQAGESKEIDFYFMGNIATFVPLSEDSTGVEKLWLRVKSGSSSAGNFSYIIYYTVY